MLHNTHMYLMLVHMHICEQIHIYKLHKMAVEIRKLKSVEIKIR